MPRAKDVAARRVFQAALTESGDYRAACRTAGISERTGRRWRRELEAPGSVGTRAPLRASATSFEGRVDDLESLQRYFDHGERLVTLVGPPGMGKTRLAKRWAETHRPALFARASPVFCDLRGARTADELITALANALDVRFQRSAHDPVDALASSLAAAGPKLLILDNFDELVGEGAPLLGGLLDAAPKVRCLVTSRRMLKLRSEVAHDLASLSLLKDTADADPWVESEAMRLFWARALAAEPELTTEAPPTKAVAALVERLDGVPLAIEICAAQLRSVGVDQLLEKLHGSLLTVENPAVDVDPRHRTLRAAIEHSYRLLSPLQQRALAQLSVFRNGFAYEAALAVVDVGDDLGVVGGALTRLREASLLRVESHPSGQRRWDLLEAVREFATEHLPPSDRQGVLTRHAEYYLTEGERLATNLRSARGARARESLHLELANLRRAFSWYRDEPGGGRKLAAMALVLHETLASSTPHAAIAAVTGALEGVEKNADLIQWRLRLLIARAATRREVGQLDGAGEDLDDATDARTETNPSSAEMGTLLQTEIAFERGKLAQRRGLAREARTHLESARIKVAPLCATAEGAHLEGRILSAYAAVLAHGFRDRAALSHHAYAAGVLEQCGDENEIAWARYYQGVSRLFFRVPEGNPTAIEDYAAALKRRGLPVQGGWFTLLAAAYRQDDGALEVASALARQAEHDGERLGVEGLRLGSACVIGLLLEERSEIDEALNRYRRAAKDYAALGEVRYEALARTYLGGAMARRGDVEGAEAELAVADARSGEDGPTWLKDLIAIRRGHVDLEHSRRHLAGGDLEAALATLRRAHERIEAGHALAACCYEARVLTRILRAACQSRPDGVATLQVARDGSGFSIAGGRTTVLRGGPIARRLLVALVERRVQAPGDPVTPDELFRRGWPGDRSPARSGRLRVKVTIRRLRDSGLSHLIGTGPSGGYLIEPTLTVELVPPAALLGHRTSNPAAV